MAERTPLQSLAATYPSSDSEDFWSVMLPGDFDDAPSGDDADQAAADTIFRSILDDHAVAEAATDASFIVARLSQMGIVGPAAISLISPTDTGLVAVTA